MDARTKLRTAAAAVAIGIMILGSPANLALAVEKQEFQDECEAGGGTFSEGANDLTCEHTITVGPDKGKKIRVICSKHSSSCVHSTVEASGPGRVVPDIGPSVPITGTDQLVPIKGGPRRP